MIQDDIKYVIKMELMTVLNPSAQLAHEIVSVTSAMSIIK